MNIAFKWLLSVLNKSGEDPIMNKKYKNRTLLCKAGKANKGTFYMIFVQDSIVTSAIFRYCTDWFQ